MFGKKKGRKRIIVIICAVIVILFLSSFGFLFLYIPEYGKVTEMQGITDWQEDGELIYKLTLYNQKAWYVSTRSLNIELRSGRTNATYVHNVYVLTEVEYIDPWGNIDVVMPRKISDPGVYYEDFDRDNYDVYFTLIYKGRVIETKLFVPCRAG